MQFRKRFASDRPRHSAPPEATTVETDSAEVWRAIDLLEADYRHGRNASLAADLVRLRHRAFEELSGEPDPDWPPAYRDPFPDVTGRPPEIGRSELTAEVLGGGIRHHGCLLVRELLSAEQVDLLRDDLDEAFAARDVFRASAAGAIPSLHYSRFRPNPGYAFDPGEREWVETSGGVWTADSPRALCDTAALFREIGIQRAVRDYLGERPALSVNKCTLRRVGPEAFPSWHQDGAFLGEGIRSVNVWIALTECGETTNAPGLGIAPRRFDHLLPTQTEGATFPNSIGEPEVARALEDIEIAYPHFAPGDALLFDELLAHCTGTRPGVTGEREALETWMFAPSSFPPSYVPLML